MSDLLERLRSALADRYAVESEVGRGGMAVVFRAEDLKHHRSVAIKVLHPELASTVGADRFLREVEIAAGLDHPHILTLLDSGQADGLLYYVMPYVEGESLRDRLARDKQLSIEEAIRVAREVADGLGHAHRHGVIHRDIKPANIMLSEGHALVADFGVATAVGGGAQVITRTGLAVGTPAYMSPEQAAGEDVSARSDLYAIGCVLYEMLAGLPPLTGPTPQATAAIRLTETATPLPVVRETVPGGLERVTQKLLAKSPADRYARAEKLIEALDDPGLWAESRPERRVLKSVGSALVAIAVLVVGVAAAQWFAVQSGRLEVVPQRVAVLPLENRSGDPSLDELGELAAERITTRLQREEVGELVPGTAVSAAVNAGESNAAGAVAAATRAGLVITGSIADSGDGLAFEIQILDGGTGTQAGSFRLEVESREEVETGLQELASRLAGGLAFAFDTDDYGAWVLSTFPTAEGFRLYREARDLQLAGKTLDAVARYHSSWVQDTTFYLPLYSTVGCYYNLGRVEEADSLNRIVGERYRPQMSAVQRDFYDGTRAWFEGDLETAIRMQRRVVAEVPDSPGDLEMLSFYCNAANRPRDVLQALREAEPYLSEDPMIRQWHLRKAVDAYHMLGDFEGELRTARGIERLGMSDPLVSAYIAGRALAGLGRAREVIEAQDRMEALSDSTARAGQMMLGVALELRAHGYADESAPAVQRSVRWFEDRPARLEADAGHRKAYGIALYHAGLLEESDRALRSLETEPDSDFTVVGYRGLLAARRGEVDEAGWHAAELERIGREHYDWRAKALAYRARIAALLEEPVEAVSLLKRAFDHALDFDYRPNWLPSRQYRFDFEGMADFAPYQELLQPKG